MPNPAIPGTPKDRTGSSGILRRATADITRRFAGLERDVLALFDRIPVYQVNAEELAAVLYGMTPAQLRDLSVGLQAALERWIANGRDPANFFWWSAYVDDAQQLGTAQAAANLASLSPAYAAARSLETIVYSAPYQTRLAIAQIQSYEHWTGLAAQQKSELSQIIGRAVMDGKNPRAVKQEIQDRLGVTKSKAITYAQTDITGTLRAARWAEADYTSQEMGLKIGMLWTSAFKPTTRQTHAARSGKVWSTEEVRAFYGRDGNRYRCYCGQTECLLDTDGRPILTERLKKTMDKERETWQKDNPA